MTGVDKISGYIRDIDGGIEDFDLDIEEEKNPDFLYDDDEAQDLTEIFG